MVNACLMLYNVLSTGIGYVKVLSSALLSIYYPLLMGLSVFYLVWCLKGPIPFTECLETFKSIVSYKLVKHSLRLS
jgi:SNF family Na+-dependent transporter